MTWLQLRDEIEDEFREHTWREHEVRIAVACHEAHKRARNAARLKAWRWRQGEIGRARERARCRTYYKCKRQEPGWLATRNARKRALIAVRKCCPAEVERLKKQSRVNKSKWWTKLKADLVRHEKRLAQMKAWRDGHKAELVKRRRVSWKRRQNNPAWRANFEAKRKAWREANREHLRQYQRDYRARVKGQQQPCRRAA